jgi:hypothetical protein
LAAEQQRDAAPEKLRRSIILTPTYRDVTTPQPIIDYGEEIS